MDGRISKLESDVEYIKRYIGEIKEVLRGHDGKFDDINQKLHRFELRASFVAGAFAVIMVIGAWIANNRFDQIMALLQKAQ